MDVWLQQMHVPSRAGLFTILLSIKVADSSIVTLLPVLCRPTIQDHRSEGNTQDYGKPLSMNLAG